MTEFFLRSARLGFRPWTPADFPLARGLWGDERVTRFFGGPFPERWIVERLAREIATGARAGVQYWPVFALDSGVHVGCAGLRPSPEPHTLELGFHLRPEHWGLGYATEAARAVLAYGFATLGLRAVVAGHHPENAASRRVLERVGFRYTHDEHYPDTGLTHRNYRLTAEEYASAG